MKQRRTRIQTNRNLKRFLLVISREKSKINKKSIININNEKTKSLGDCRADGWIYNDKLCILIETKIGYNKVLTTQLYRHLTGRHGFNMSHLTKDKFELITVSWENIAIYFQRILNDNRNNTPFEKLFINQFLEYLAMTGEIFSFKNIVEGKADKNIQKKQLHFLVRNILDCVSKKIPGFKYKPNRKAQVRAVWEQLGPDNIHFSIYVWSDRIAIDLAIMEFIQKKVLINLDVWNKLKKKVWFDHFKIAVEDKNSTAHRYELYLTDYRIFDRYKGLQNSGVNRNRSAITFNGEWIKSHYNNEKSFNNFLDLTIKPLLGKYKQFGLRYCIMIPEMNELSRRKDKRVDKWNDKDSPRYFQDVKDLENPMNVVHRFCDFILTWEEIIGYYY